MDSLEKVEKLREKAGVSYGEAKAALDACDGDLLDALLLLEKQGKVKGPKAASYTTRAEDGDRSEAFREASQVHEQAAKGGGTLRRFLGWLGDLIRKGCENFFIVSRHGEDVLTMPVLVLLLLLLAFAITLPLLIVGLFFGFTYRFSGNIAKTDVNMAMNKASEAAERIKTEFSGEENR